MSKMLRRCCGGLLILAVGAGFFLYGIGRQEHAAVAQKASIICLECIGIK